ncbi:acyltransferase [Mucilaginibacter mali]|uniref:Acyltransferase n=1 Tax=Mucilaginibacter mali TaxID=2740462 RepID=A0A7D4QG62_9SPHI|nr:acyltransferase [Mucilaginibacter mali]QKJ30852.1 acyltransferase [Mucilaginibacter mali]
MKVFFKNLNSLRFIAASLVIIHHTEQYKWFNGLHHYFNNPIIILFGKLGVDIFFVLSGFLITSLLVIEKERFGRIAIRKFYIRRILRIWPLYFLVAALAFLVWPHIPALHISQMPNPYDHLWENALLILFFLPNIQYLLFRAIPYQAQSWSIGVEEQFYLVWPFLMNWSKTRLQFKRIVIILLAAYVIIKLAFYFIPLITGRFKMLDDLDFYLSDIFQIDCMMIGSLFGLLNFENKARQLLTGTFVQVAAYLLAIGFLSFGLNFGYFYWEIYGVLFGIIIFNLVNTDTSIISLEFKWMDYLGKISYSMYMLHVLVVNIVIRFISHNSFIIYPLVFLFTIIISIASYELFEKRFLKYKSGFAKVQSGSDPKVGM